MDAFLCMSFMSLAAPDSFSCYTVSENGVFCIFFKINAWRDTMHGVIACEGGRQYLVELKYMPLWLLYNKGYFLVIW